jgi:hypothetical protein
MTLLQKKEKGDYAGDFANLLSFNPDHLADQRPEFTLLLAHFNPSFVN